MTTRFRLVAKARRAKKGMLVSRKGERRRVSRNRTNIAKRMSRSRRVYRWTHASKSESRELGWIQTCSPRLSRSCLLSRSLSVALLSCRYLAIKAEREARHKSWQKEEEDVSSHRVVFDRASAHRSGTRHTHTHAHNHARSAKPPCSAGRRKGKCRATNSRSALRKDTR